MSILSQGSLINDFNIPGITSWLYKHLGTVSDVYCVAVVLFIGLSKFALLNEMSFFVRYVHVRHKQTTDITVASTSEKSEQLLCFWFFNSNSTPWRCQPEWSLVTVNILCMTWEFREPQWPSPDSWHPLLVSLSIMNVCSAISCRCVYGIYTI